MKTPASLPLVPFERYMLADDRTHVPMAFIIRLKLVGRFDPVRFREAMVDILRDEPLLTGRITGKDLRTTRWVPGDGSITLDCQPTGTPLLYPRVGSIDIRHEPGLRTWVRYDDQQVELRFQFHHSCADGIGAYQFIDDVLCEYHRRVTGEATLPRRVKRVEMLKQRGRLGLSWWQRCLRLPLTLLAIIHGGANFFIVSPVKLALPPVTPPGENELRQVPEMPTTTVDSTTFARLSAFCKREHLKLNDLLTRELMLAIKSWQEQLTGQPWRGTMRIIVPFNLRAREDEAQPATNIVGVIPMDRGPLQLKHAGWLMKTVRYELKYMKFFWLPAEFLSVLRFFELVCGSTAMLLADHRCQTTVTWSNVGRVFTSSPLPREQGKLRCGELVLEEVGSAPPVRPHSPVSFTATSYNGQLTWTLCYDRLALNYETAQKLLNHVIAQLQNFAASLPN